MIAVLSAFILVLLMNINRRKQVQETLLDNYTLISIAGETAKFGGWGVDLRSSLVIWSDTVADTFTVILPAKETT